MKWMEKAKQSVEEFRSILESRRNEISEIFLSQLDKGPMLTLLLWVDRRGKVGFDNFVGGAVYMIEYSPDYFSVRYNVSSLFPSDRDGSGAKGRADELAGEFIRREVSWYSEKYGAQ